MHSRIYQVTRQPIEKEDFITEADFFEHWFLGGVADYVDEDTDRKSDLEWLQDRNGIEVNVDCETLTVISKEDYFRDKFFTFKECLEKLGKMTEEAFRTDENKDYEIYKLNYKLKEAYDDKFGFYIWAEGWGLVTLDYFVRNIAEEGETFYIGATLDYHF